MPRTYKRAVGSRTYCDYSQETLRECLEKVRNGELTRAQASAAYNVPVKTIYNRLKPNENLKKPGGQPVFSEEEELRFVRNLLGSAAFGFPFDTMDIRMVVRHYLLEMGRQVDRFKNGTVPGDDWIAGFLSRHPEIRMRIAKNIKTNRAAISEKTLTDYINNLKITVEGVPPDRIYNYDETNLTDDPGARKVAVKRGSKYPEMIMNSSKSCTSLMMCGNAVGEVLPPYVVYKAGKMWESWRENGPRGTRYNCSSSGWFDKDIFYDWFRSLLIPHVKHKPEKKILIGDNLSSHFSAEVLALCEEHNIVMVCLPPNSTHLTQPLDVAYFGPMKRAWRTILKDWKLTGHGRRDKILQKSDFAALLQKLWCKLLGTGGANLVSGFRACGIYPTGVEHLLKRLPGHNEDVQKIDQSFKEFLSEQRKILTDGGERKRRKKTRVTPGKSIGNVSSDEENSEDEDNNLETENQGNDTSEFDIPPPVCIYLTVLFLNFVLIRYLLINFFLYSLLNLLQCRAVALRRFLLRVLIA